MVLSVAGNAAAEHRAGSFTLSPGVGHFGFDSDLDLEDDMAGGLGLGYNITENFGLEASYYYADTEANNRPLDRDGDSADGDVHFAQLNALYHFMTDKKVVPYLAAGAGVFVYDLDKITGDNDTSEFATNVGGGVKCFVHKNVALFADVRSVQTYPECSWLGTVGISFYMGGCEKKAEAAPAAPQPAAVEEPVDQERLAFEKEDIYFAFDKSDLSADAQSILKKKAAWLDKNPDAAVTIEGHCDERGTNEYNIALGERRATSARDFLVNLGTDLTRLTTISFGEERPVDAGHTEDAWSKNRRAHFVLK
ncbi:MAG: peptidoglycan-associated lipoprotein Pal [Thermodesulfobacteriota bacterium]